jgi:hypothetical protein
MVIQKQRKLKQLTLRMEYNTLILLGMMIHVEKKMTVSNLVFRRKSLRLKEIISASL